MARAAARAEDAAHGAGRAAGCLVLSGLLADELSAVAEGYSRVLGVAPIRTAMGEWHCLRFVTACPPVRQDLGRS